MVVVPYYTSSRSFWDSHGLSPDLTAETVTRRRTGAGAQSRVTAGTAVPMGHQRTPKRLGLVVVGRTVVVGGYQWLWWWSAAVCSEGGRWVSSTAG